MKVFKINDTEWWMAATLNQAIVASVRNAGCTISDAPDADELKQFEGAEIDEPRELTDAELDSHEYIDERMRQRHSFREELAKRIAEGARTEMFATTEI